MIRFILMAGAAAIALGACVVVQQKPRADAVDNSALAGSEWGPDNGLDQFVQFRVGGELSGFAGCNNFFGSFTENGESLKVGPLASTKKMCPDMGAETAFMTALQNARSFERSIKTLTIFDANGETVLKLRRRDWD